MLWKDPSGSQRATMPEWSKGHDSSSCGFGRVGSNPTRSIGSLSVLCAFPFLMFFVLFVPFFFFLDNSSYVEPKIRKPNDASDFPSGVLNSQSRGHVRRQALRGCGGERQEEAGEAGGFGLRWRGQLGPSTRWGSAFPHQAVGGSCSLGPGGAHLHFKQTVLVLLCGYPGRRLRV